MQYNYWLDVCGFALLAILITIYLLKQTVSIFQNTLFYVLLMCCLFATVFDVVGVAVDGQSKGAVILVHSVIIFLDVMTSFFYGFYIAAFCKYHISKKFLGTVLLPPAIICTVMLLINTFGGFIFFVNEKNQFVWSRSSVVFFAVASYYVFLVIVLLILARDAMSREKLILVIPFTVLIIVAGVVEYIYPFMLCKHFSECLLGVVLYFGIRNPDELFDSTTGMLNETALSINVDKRLSSDKKFYIIAVYVHDIERLPRTMGREAAAAIIDQISDFFYGFDNTCMSFRVSSGLYCMIPERDDRGYACDIQNAVVDRFSKRFSYGSVDADLITSTLMLEMPKDAKDYTILMDVLRLFTKVSVTRNMTVVSTADLDLKHLEYMKSVDEKVRNAIKDDRLEVYYQPIFSCKERRFVAAEALLRMHDDDGSFISPEIFVPIAENNGTIVEIDNFVMERVCWMISRNKINDLGVHYIEVNLSPGDCIQENLVENVQRLMKKYNVVPSSLNFEITETAADEMTGIVDYNVRALNDLGISLSLDDFGTGYSSLSRILALPLKIIKIDKTLVQPAFNYMKDDDAGDERSKNITNTHSMTLLRSSVDMVKRIGGEIVTEGVETKEQAEEIIRMGVDYIQGFYFARPMPEKDFIDLIKGEPLSRITELEV